MTLNDEILIEATSDKVWEYVGSPEMWPLFHAKAGECKQVSSQADVVGAQYDIEFRLGSKTAVTRCEIIDRRIGGLIIVKSTLPDANRQAGRPMSACMTYELEDLGRTTKVTEDIDISGASIPFILKPLIWFITRFGKPSGETTLMGLKRVVEE
jgi:hypothetical protein